MDRTRIARRLLRIAKELIAGHSAVVTTDIIDENYQNGQYELGKNPQEGSNPLPNVAAAINAYLDDIAKILTESFQDNTGSVAKFFADEDGSCTAIKVDIDDQDISVVKEKIAGTKSLPSHPKLVMTIPARLMAEDNVLYEFTVTLSVEFKYGDKDSEAIIEYNSYDRKKNTVKIKIDTSLDAMDNPHKPTYTEQDKNAMFKGVMAKVLSAIRQKAAERCTLKELLGTITFSKFKAFMNDRKREFDKKSWRKWDISHTNPYFSGQEEYYKWEKENREEYQNGKGALWMENVTKNGIRMVVDFFQGRKSEMEDLDREFDMQMKRMKSRRQMEERINRTTGY